MQYQYLLVENNQTVLLGPMFWKPRYIQSELEELGVTFILPPVDPESYLAITPTLMLYPIQEINSPSYDTLFEQLSGPYWQFVDHFAIGTYNVVDIEIDSIKNTMKSNAASVRYKKEVGGINVTIQGIEVLAATDRESRNIFAQKLLIMSDNDIVQWKFPDEIWINMTKTDMNTLLATVTNYVQQQYDWEKQIVDEIDAAQTIQELKNILIQVNAY